MNTCISNIFGGEVDEKSILPFCFSRKFRARTVATAVPAWRRNARGNRRESSEDGCWTSALRPVESSAEKAGGGGGGSFWPTALTPNRRRQWSNARAAMAQWRGNPARPPRRAHVTRSAVSAPPDRWVIIIRARVQLFVESGRTRWYYHRAVSALSHAAGPRDPARSACA